MSDSTKNTRYCDYGSHNYQPILDITDTLYKPTTTGVSTTTKVIKAVICINCGEIVNTHHVLKEMKLLVE